MLASNQEHYNRLLTGVSVEFKNLDYVGHEIAKPMNVSNETDVYRVYDKSAFDIVDDTRADGDPAKTIDYGWTEAAYRVEGHGLNTKITDKQRRNADNQQSLDNMAVRRVVDKVMLRHEQRMFGAGGFLRTAANNIGSTNTDWSNLGTADVKASIELAVDAVEVASGMTPNVMALGPNIGRWIARTAQWQEGKYVVDIRKEGGAPVERLPSDIFGLKPIYVGGLINSTKKGQATSLSRLMGDDVWIGYVNPAAELGEYMLTHCTTIWTDRYVRKWYDSKREADFIEFNYNHTIKLIARECGYLLTTVTQA